ncbi:MAG: twin-arginine translocation signal domain-containing protein [Caldilineaceae bacterium]
MTMCDEQQDRSSKPEDPEMLSRRRFLTRLSIGVGALGATLAGIPVLGFMLSPLLTKTPEVWRAVGALDSFQVGQTVEVSFEDASPLPWASRPRQPPGCAATAIRSLWPFRSTARTWAVRCAGYKMPNFLCVPVTVVSITDKGKMWPGHLAAPGALPGAHQQRSG